MSECETGDKIRTMPVIMDVTTSVNTLKMAMMLKQPRLLVVGYVMEFWIWCNTHLSTEEIGLDAETFDSFFALSGFSAALLDVGWVVEDEQGLLIAAGATLTAMGKSPCCDQMDSALPIETYIVTVIDEQTGEDQQGFSIFQDAYPHYFTSKQEALNDYKIACSQVCRYKHRGLIAQLGCVEDLTIEEVKSFDYDYSIIPIESYSESYFGS